MVKVFFASQENLAYLASTLNETNMINTMKFNTQLGAESIETFGSKVEFVESAIIDWEIDFYTDSFGIKKLEIKTNRVMAKYWTSDQDIDFDNPEIFNSDVDKGWSFMQAHRADMFERAVRAIRLDFDQKEITISY